MRGETRGNNIFTQVKTAGVRAKAGKSFTPDEQGTLPIGQRVSLLGHFDVPVILEDARPLGDAGSGGYECRVRLPDGSLDETVISAAEARALLQTSTAPSTQTRPVDAERLRLLIESARIRLAYAHDPQFAVSPSEAVVKFLMPAVCAIDAPC